MVLIHRAAHAFGAPALGAAAIGLWATLALGQEPATPAPAPRAASVPRATAWSSWSSGAAAATAPPSAATSATATAWTDEQTLEALSAAVADRRQQRRTAWLGIGLSCTRCSYHTEGKSLSRWVFNEPPVLYQVDPASPADRAGLRTGDTLLSINGQDLTSLRGGQAFANMTPGVAVRLGFRRDGRDRTTSVRPEEPPAQRELADAQAGAAEALRSAEASRALGRTYQRDSERAQRELQRAQEELSRNRGKLLSEESTQRIREYLDQARRALESSQSPLLAYPSPTPGVAPVPPMAASPELTPVPPAAEAVPPVVAPTAPTPRGLGWAVSPPGGLRYSGRLGSTLIEARRPGGVNVLETGDSEVVLTGGDLSVRIALEPGRVARGRVLAAPAGWSSARSSAGDVARGIQGYLVNPRLGRAFGAPYGVLVLDVESGSHADSLGILAGDVLVTLNEHPVRALTSDALLTNRLLRQPAQQPGAQSAVVVRNHVRRELRLSTAPHAQRPATVPPTRLRR
jgi:hypothetical protein